MFKNELNNNYIVQLFLFFKVLMISNILFLFKEVCIYLVSKSILIVMVLQKDNFKRAKIRTVKKCII